MFTLQVFKTISGVCSKNKGEGHLEILINGSHIKKVLAVGGSWWVMVDGGGYILAGGGWWWLVEDMFWLVVDGGGWWWVVVDGGGWWHSLV